MTEEELIIVLLIALNLVLVGLIILILRHNRVPGPPGAVDMTGEPGKDLYFDSVHGGLVDRNMGYGVWLRNLNVVIRNQSRLETSTYIPGIGDIGGPKG
jgi:hypothetical protein